MGNNSIQPEAILLGPVFPELVRVIDDGVGSDQRFWQLAQTLSALYPSAAEEKRWVDGLLARKKGVGS
jgi:hypothetical protein